MLFVLLASATALAQVPAPPPSALTAQVTDVADAADVGNPFDFNASIGFSRTQKFAKITRENAVGGRTVYADELSYSQVQQQLDIRAQVSLFHDLELNWYMPYIFNQDTTLDYRTGVSAANSTVTTDPTVGGPLFGVPFRSFKRGLDHMDLGVAWSPLNDSRDDTKPTWTLRFTYGIPIGAAFKPALVNPTVQAKPAALSDRTHRLTWEMALSKRFGYLDPYFSMKFMLPVSDGSYKDANGDALNPSIVGGFYTGFEIVPWENPGQRQRLSVDFRAGANFVGPGRVVSEVSDALRQLTSTDNYAQLQAGFHLFLQAVEYVRFSAGVTLQHDTPHTLTNEVVGDDRNGNGVVDLDDTAERNPRYNDAVDKLGHRFRVEEMVNVNFYVALALTL